MRAERMRHTGCRRGFRHPLLASVVALSAGLQFTAALTPTSATAAVAARRVLVPIGGDYSQLSIRAFARIAARGASAPSLDLLVVPAAYGHSPSVPANVKQALVRTAEVGRACLAVLPEFPALSTCNVSLVRTFRRVDASKPKNVAAFRDPQVDGAYFLGGIQGFAMHILGGTPLEAAMGDAFGRGAAFGGTSAGDAVLSHTMIESFAPGYGADTELQRGAVLIDWADSPDPTKRGLAFGSDRAIFDEHYYQRGRFGRLIDIVAQSADHFGGAGRLGIGVDVRTGATDVNDTRVTRTFGRSSAAVIDFGTAGATHDWMGPEQTLSARNVLTQLVAPGRGVGYDVAGRVAEVRGVAVPFIPPGSWPDGLLRAPGRGDLILGGDVSGDLAGPALGRFVARARASGGNRILAVFAGYPGAGKTAAAEDAYRSGLRGAGWTGRIRMVGYGRHGLPPARLAGAAGVLMVGGDQSLLRAPLADAAFRELVGRAVAGAPVVMTDGALTPAMGDRYVANPDPTPADLEVQSVADFRTAYNKVRRGLGIVAGADFEPRLTQDYRWGRLYGLSRSDPSDIVFGICQLTALVLHPRAPAAVSGARSVVALDGRTATFVNGTNGALSALNVLMNLYAPGEEVSSPR